MCALVYALNDSDERVRQEAADEIGDALRKNCCCCSPDVVAALTCALGDCDRGVVRQAKQALESCGYEVVDPCCDPCCSNNVCCNTNGCTPTGCAPVGAPAAAPVIHPAPTAPMLAPTPEPAPAPAPAPAQTRNVKKSLGQLLGLLD